MKRFLSVFTAGALLASAALAFDSRAALGLVLKTCEMNFKLSGAAFPCLKVFMGAEPLTSYAILREPLADQRTIFSPLADFTGVEDPRLLIPGTPNYFSLAWNERKRVIPRDEDSWESVALAVNAAVFRTQDHLHIHMGCVVPDVSKALAAATVSSTDFRRLNIKLNGQIYWARFLPANDLSDINPVKLVADGVSLAKRSMGGVTIAVVGAKRNGTRGFIILAHAMGLNPKNPASAESMIDPQCGL
jgi:CDP-diacylglycerol pyrophosphatase